MKNLDYPSFVKRSSAGLNLWAPVVTEEWQTDMVQGRSYAQELVSHMRETGHPTLLNHVVKAMVGHGMWSGVEVGFFQQISVEVIGLENHLRHMQELCHEDEDGLPVT